MPIAAWPTTPCSARGAMRAAWLKDDKRARWRCWLIKSAFRYSQGDMLSEALGFL